MRMLPVVYVGTVCNSFGRSKVKRSLRRPRPELLAIEGLAKDVVVAALFPTLAHLQVLPEAALQEYPSLKLRLAAFGSLRIRESQPVLVWINYQHLRVFQGVSSGGSLTGTCAPMRP